MARSQFGHIQKLEGMLCEGYGIPKSYIDFIYNEEPEKNIMRLNRKFRRNFRGEPK